MRAEPLITEAFRTGAGMGWHAHHEDVDCLKHPSNVYGEQVRYPEVSHMPWVSI